MIVTYQSKRAEHTILSGFLADTI